jgi:hypothetical protein
MACEVYDLSMNHREHTLPCPDCNTPVTGPLDVVLVCRNCGAALKLKAETPVLPHAEDLEVRELGIG